MFSRVQTKYFRSLKSVDQRLGRFHALVGPNASGKTTFLDVLILLGDLIDQRGDVREVVADRSSSFHNLIWEGPVKEDKSSLTSFQLAIEAPIPASIAMRMSEDKKSYGMVRYELELGIDPIGNAIGVNHETLWLIQSQQPEIRQRDLFPEVRPAAPDVVETRSQRSGRRVAIRKQPDGNDNYYTEGKKSFMPSFRLGRGKLALAHVPEDELSFPVSLWFRSLLETGIQSIVLNSQIIRRPSPPGLGRGFQVDGSNLPWVVEELGRDEFRFDAWLAHVRTALPDIRTIETVEREEDRHRYLVITYENGARVPSWLVSDGTLRLLALTIPAYLEQMTGVFLIEEPENGIHPRAIETVIQSLSSIYDGQVLIATHSPVALNLLKPETVLCFAKNAEGATDIVSGDTHPALREWRRGQPDLGLLFAAGILS